MLLKFKKIFFRKELIFFLNLENRLEKKYFTKLEGSLVIKLTLNQLVYLGIHIGHLKKNSSFLSSWIFFGWRYNIFIIDLVKTLIMTRLALKTVKKVIRYGRPFWFVTMNSAHGPLIGRYASICGEPFNVFWWVGGSLTNLKMILDWNVILINLMKKEKYLFRHQDKKKLIYYYGFLKQRMYAQNDASDVAKTVRIFRKQGRVPYKRFYFSHNRIYKQRNLILNKTRYGNIKPFKFPNLKIRMRWFFIHFYEVFWRKPGAGFIPTVLDNIRIVDEFAVSDLPFITLVDSNVKSGDVMLPIPSNDDSIQSIIFFTYIITKNIFISKLLLAKKWKQDIIKGDQMKYLKYQYIFLKNMEDKEKINVENDFDTLLTDVLSSNIVAVNVQNNVKYNMFIPHETIFSSDFYYDAFKFMNLKWKNFKV